jgi:hypothetical protein
MTAPSTAAHAGATLTVPIKEISELLNHAMKQTTDNGADSRSMPDEYVAIAHFTCYPEQYGFLAAPTPVADSGASDELLTMIDNNRESLGNIATVADEKNMGGLARALRKVADTLELCRSALTAAKPVSVDAGGK